MGYMLRKRGDFHGAILRYSQALAQQPGHFSALFNRGFSYDKVAMHPSCQLAVPEYMPVSCPGGPLQPQACLCRTACMKQTRV